MATYSKEKLSHSTSGKNIVVSATSTLGNNIHTAVAGASDLDEIWLYACNTDSSDRKVTIEYGGAAASPAATVTEITITAEAGWVLIVPGLLLNGGLVVTVFAAATNVVNINGYVNRIAA